MEDIDHMRLITGFIILVAIIAAIYWYRRRRTEGYTKIRSGVGFVNTGDDIQVAAGVIQRAPVLDYTYTYYDGRDMESCDACPNPTVCPHCPQYSRVVELTPGAPAKHEGFLAGAPTGIDGAAYDMYGRVADSLVPGNSHLPSQCPSSAISAEDVAFMQSREATSLRDTARRPGRPLISDAYEQAPLSDVAPRVACGRCVTGLSRAAEETLYSAAMGLDY